MSGLLATPGSKARIALAVVPFLASMLLLGFSFRTGALRAFAIGWPLLQIGGYLMALNIAKEDLHHSLVKGQIMLHYLALVLVLVVFSRAM